MKVICINDEGRPEAIPLSKWVKKGNEYTVIDIIKCGMQPGKPFAYILAEIDLSGCDYYKGFSIHRFTIPDIDKAIEMAIDEMLVGESVSEPI